MKLEGTVLKHEACPVYLGVTLDRSLHYPINNTARRSARKLGHATTLSECWQATLGELVQILSADHLWLLFTQQLNMQHLYMGVLPPCQDS